MWYAVIIGLMFLAAALVVAVKVHGKKDAPDRPGDILGKEGYVTEMIDNEESVGRVRIGGMDWKALHVRGDRTVEKGAVVRVVGIRGHRLVVEQTGVYLEVEDEV